MFWWFQRCTTIEVWLHYTSVLIMHVRAHCLILFRKKNLEVNLQYLSCLYTFATLDFQAPINAWLVCWLVVLGLTSLWDSISVYIRPSLRERKKEEKKDRWEKKKSKQPPPASTANAVGPCPTIVQISRTTRPWRFSHHLRTTGPSTQINASRIGLVNRQLLICTELGLQCHISKPNEYIPERQNRKIRMHAWCVTNEGHNWLSKF